MHIGKKGFDDAIKLPHFRSLATCQSSLLVAELAAVTPSLGNRGLASPFSHLVALACRSPRESDLRFTTS